MSEAASARCLDVRRLEPPEPMERILDALADLPEGERLWVLHRREPFPLYDLLRRMGYEWHARAEPERVEILIWPEGSPPSQSELEGGIPC